MRKFSFAVFILSGLLFVCSCIGKNVASADTSTADQVISYPTDLKGHDLFTLSEIRANLPFQEKTVLLKNTDKDSDYVCIYARPVSDQDERPEEIIERLETDLSRQHRLIRDIMSEIRKTNHADHFTNLLSFSIADEKGLREYFADEPQGQYPCIPLAVLKRGESTTLSVRLMKRDSRVEEQAVPDEETDSMPNIHYALFAIPCSEPKPGVSISLELRMPPERIDQTGTFQAGDDVMVYATFKNTGNINLNDSYIIYYYGVSFGIYFNDCLIRADINRDVEGFKGGSRYMLTEEDVKNGYVSAQITGWAMPDLPDRSEPFQFEYKGKLYLREIK